MYCVSNCHLGNYSGHFAENASVFALGAITGFEVSVEDNGCGMSGEKLAEFNERLLANRLTAESPSRKGGNGAVSVHRASGWRSSEQYGLRIENKPELRATKLIMMPPASYHGRSHQQSRRLYAGRLC